MHNTLQMSVKYFTRHDSDAIYDLIGTESRGAKNVFLLSFSCF